MFLFLKVRCRLSFSKWGGRGRRKGQGKIPHPISLRPIFAFFTIPSFYFLFIPFPFLPLLSILFLAFLPITFFQPPGHTSPQQAPLPIPRDVLCFQAPINPFTPKSDQFQISPAATPEIWHHTVWKTWLFIAHSDRRWLYYQFSLLHSYNCFLKGWENTLFELRSERVSRLSLLNLGVKGRHKMIRATQIMSVLRATPYAETTR